MNILVASDKFKGSLTAVEACAAVEAGLRDAFPGRFTIQTLPVADGGDGLSQTLTDAKGGVRKTCRVRDALGETTEAGYGWLDDGRIAVIEMAEASGLAQLGSREKDPWRASTFGTGELILDAIRQGAEEIILGIGGSATNDGGSGMAQALGFRFLDGEGKEIHDIPLQLSEARTIEPPSDRQWPKILVACDVENPLLGQDGCTRVYGPQKGILEQDIAKHEARLEHLVSLLGDEAKQAATLRGSGAAGGLGFGGMLFLHGELVPGFALVSGLLDLESHITRADLVITGEGRIDRQTGQGKAPAGVARLAKANGKPVYAFCGILEEGAGEQFDECTGIRDPGLSMEENMNEAPRLLREAAEKFAASI